MNLTKKLFVFREQFERCCALATLLERKENAGCPNQNLVVQHQKTGMANFGFETHILESTRPSMHPRGFNKGRWFRSSCPLHQLRSIIRYLFTLNYSKMFRFKNVVVARVNYSNLGKEL